MSSAGGTIVVGEQDLLTTVRYAGASGDLNPLHWDPRAAERAGFERVLVHGGWMAASIERALESVSEPLLLSVKFERPVMIGEPLQLDWAETEDGIDAALRVATDRRVSARLTVVAEAQPLDGLQVLDEPFAWQVEHGALRAFLAATGLPERSRPGIPLAFLSNAGRWSQATTSIVRRLGLAYDRMLHGSAEFQLLNGPILPGERLKVTEAHANRLKQPHRGGGTMQIADTVQLIDDPDGRPRARIVNRFIERPARKAA